MEGITTVKNTTSLIVLPREIVFTNGATKAHQEIHHIQ